MYVYTSHGTKRAKLKERKRTIILKSNNEKKIIELNVEKQRGIGYLVLQCTLPVPCIPGKKTTKTETNSQVFCDALKTGAYNLFMLEIAGAVDE